MSEQAYYHYQAIARGVYTLEDVRRIAESKAHIYDRIVMPWLPAERHAPIAELACGHGSFLAWLQSRGFTRRAGIDASPEQIALARQTGAQAHEEDVITWLRAQPAASWHAVVGIDLVEHLPKDVFLALLSEAKRVLLPGGSLILRLPNGDSPLVGLNLFNDVTHVWTYTSNCLETLAAMHGYEAASFIDEAESAIRDARWLKLPLHRASKAVLNFLFRAASYERVRGWSPHLWARFVTATL
jgi:SAM-dependent methyltransferase